MQIVIESWLVGVWWLADLVVGWGVVLSVVCDVWGWAKDHRAITPKNEGRTPASSVGGGRWTTDR